MASDGAGRAEDIVNRRAFLRFLVLSGTIGPTVLAEAWPTSPVAASLPVTLPMPVDSEVIRFWSGRLWLGVHRETLWSKFMGPGSGSIIQVNR